jgi:dienelactone hydrolase
MLRTTALFISAIAVLMVPFAMSGADRSPEETRAAFLKVIERPGVPAAATETVDQLGDFQRVKFSYDSEKNQRVPGFILRQPGKSRRAAVIVLHGTGGSKEGELSLLKQLAARGFAGMAIDGRFHGERGNSAAYNAAIARSFEIQRGHPLYWDTVWDVMRLVDYLQTRDDIDPKRIGLMGISKGGIETYFAAAADPRIAAAVPCIGVQSFQWALEHDAWRPRVGTVRKGFDAAAASDGVSTPDAGFVRKFYARIVPGIESEFDGPIMLKLIAPRPLLIINGEKDGLTPLGGLKLCADSARAAYEAAKVPEKFQQIIEANAGHTVTAESRAAAVDWFAKWLLPDPRPASK